MTSQLLGGLHVHVLIKSNNISVFYLLFIKNGDRGTAGDKQKLNRSHWSNLRCLLPLMGAWSGEELRTTESEARPLPRPRRASSQPFVPYYESTRSSAEIWKKGLNQSGPLVFSPGPCKGKRCKTGSQSLHVFIIHLFILIHSSFACGGVRMSGGPGLRSYGAGRSYVWPPLHPQRRAGQVAASGSSPGHTDTGCPLSHGSCCWGNVGWFRIKAAQSFIQGVKYIFRNS